MKKVNTIALGLHLVPGVNDNILAYSDGIADVDFEHLDETKEKGGFQSDINKELKDAIKDESEWHEE